MKKQTRLLLAPAAGGKTAQVIERIRALPPLAPAHVLVPDRIEAAAFRRRLAQAGGALGVEVQTFYDLYTDILAAAGGAPSLPQAGFDQALARLPTVARQQLIHHLAQTLRDEDRIPHYAPLSHSPGFARLLGELFGELKRARIFPETLEHSVDTPGCDPRLAELAPLYTAYQAWLLDNGWADAEGQGWLAAIALEQNPALFSDLALLAVDGFDEFDPTQLYLLRLLADRAGTTLVTLTTDPHHPDRLAHRRFARARSALTEALEIESLTLPAQRREEPLVHLEQTLFQPHASTAPGGDAIQFLEAQNRAAEAREALRWLKARIVREGVSPSEVAIVARQVEPYRSFLEEAAAEFGMPLSFVTGAELGANPAIAALLKLLALPRAPVNWSPGALLDVLSSPYFDWRTCGLGSQDSERLLHLAHAGQVVSGLDQWREAFGRLSASEMPDLELLDEEQPASHRPSAGEGLSRLRTVFERIVATIQPPDQAPLREWIAWVEKRIGQDPAMEGKNRPDATACLYVIACARETPVTARRDVAALRAFKDILRGLLLANTLLNPQPEAPLSDAAFVARLTQAVEGATYRAPVEGPAILVASALEARGLVFDAVALLGLAEGEFPRPEREDALLRESDRAWLVARGLPIQPRLRGDEATLFYQAVTRAHRRLLLCRPYLAEDGQHWEPSPYWSAVERLFEDAPVAHVRPTDPVVDPASEQERREAIPDETASFVAQVMHARSRAEPSPWSGDLSPLQGLLATRFGEDRAWSSSRLETYAKCPFYFWATYVMELEPRDLPELGFDVLILGSIYHLVLERLYARVSDGDPQRLRELLPVVAQQVFAAAPHDYGFRPTPLWERQQEELTDTLAHTLEGLIDVAGEYSPTAPELAFGLRGKPPLVLPGEPVIQLRGYIDRVDRAPDGRLRVIDYKAGSTPISTRELDEGTRLQLPLYALAAERVLGGKVSSGFYWHIGSARPSTLKLEQYKGGVPDAIETAVAHAREIVSAARAGRFPAHPLDGGCPPFCPAAAFCERFEPRTW